MTKAWMITRAGANINGAPAGVKEGRANASSSASNAAKEENYENPRLHLDNPSPKEAQRNALWQAGRYIHRPHSGRDLLGLLAYFKEPKIQETLFRKMSVERG